MGIEDLVIVHVAPAVVHVDFMFFHAVEASIVVLHGVRVHSTAVLLAEVFHVVLVLEVLSVLVFLILVQVQSLNLIKLQLVVASFLHIDLMFNLNEIILKFEFFISFLSIICL